MNKHYTTIAQALGFIEARFPEQVSLEAVAQHVKLSPFHLQRLFTLWAGVSPKKFGQYLSVSRAKELLRSPGISTLKTVVDTGLSSGGRLHDLFVTIEGVTPGEFKTGGKGLVVEYALFDSLFGHYLVASTPKGICNIIFYDGSSQTACAELKNLWPAATIVLKKNLFHQHVADFLNQKKNTGVKPFKLHLKGTPFQLKVWEALLTIPEGRLSSYGAIAAKIKKPTAQRAVGTAIGDNPVAFLIPCHRVIKNTGRIGNYRWGRERKLAMIGWEGAKSESKE